MHLQKSPTPVIILTSSSNYIRRGSLCKNLPPLRLTASIMYEDLYLVHGDTSYLPSIFLGTRKQTMKTENKNPTKKRLHRVTFQ